MPAPPSVPDLQSALAELGELDVAPEDVANAVGRAVADTYRRLVDPNATIRANVDLDAGAVHLARHETDGSEVPIDLPTGEAGRQLAVAARAAVTQQLRLAERQRTLREGSLRRTQLIDTIVEHRRGNSWLLRAGELWAVLPPEEQMAGETPEVHRHLKVIVVEARHRQRDAVVVVSRSHPKLLERLLEQEVPELLSGDVVIAGIAREAGRRSKVAVLAPHANLDARGTCIGPRGIRHRAVTSELGAEQVQIIAWDADAATFVGNAMAPASVEGVELDEVSKTAHVTVAGDQLSLAIGKGGENARLAARLTGWRIDIRGSAAAEEPQ